MSQELEEVLKRHQNKFKQVVPFNLNDECTVIFDLTADNKELDQVILNDEQSFNSYIFQKLKENNSPAGIGRYNEDRIIYKISDVFTAKELRSVHIGIDVWAEAGTPVFAPLNAIVHSFNNNSASGDYGPTIILEHKLEEITFYTLYGHLSIQSLEGLQQGQSINSGQQIATLGAYHENVHWPPHLHFQLIRDMKGHTGDYPGVAPPSRREEYLWQCPDPNLILNISHLKQSEEIQ